MIRGVSVRPTIHGQKIIVIHGEELRSETPLLEVIQANGCFAFAFGAAERGQEQARQNGDDGNHHQQLD